jgi:hypothetical protein
MVLKHVSELLGANQRQRGSGENNGEPQRRGDTENKAEKPDSTNEHCQAFLHAYQGSQPFKQTPNKACQLRRLILLLPLRFGTVSPRLGVSAVGSLHPYLITK